MLFRILIPLFISACTWSKPKNPYDDCDEIKIGPATHCDQVADGFRCQTEVECVKKLKWIRDGYGICYDPTL